MDNAKTEFRWRVARSFALVAYLAGCCMAAGSPAKAQATSASQGSGSSPRLLSAEGGRAIVDAVQDQDQPRRGVQDCSHLVHQMRSEEHTSELQSHVNLVCRLLLEKKKTMPIYS